MDNLSDKQLEEKVNEIRKLNLHTWWGFCISERMLDAVFGESRPIPATETNNEEGCMALSYDEKPEYEEIGAPITIKKVNNAEDFKL